MSYRRSKGCGAAMGRLTMVLLLLFLSSGCASTAFLSNTNTDTQTDKAEATAGQQAAESSDAGRQDVSSAVSGPSSRSGDKALSTDDVQDLGYVQPVPVKGEGPAQPKGAEQASQSETEAAIQAEIDKALEYYEASQDFWQQGEFDNALHALDQAYQQIMTVDAAELPKFIQQKDDLRYMISKRILEIYASRHNTAKGNGHAIPREMNQHIRREVKFFTEGRGRGFFINAYKRSGRYRPYIVEQLKKAGLPEELSWIPLIESGYKTRALSRARALGLWQFISSTGYKFGLKKNQYVDERLDPFASTHAAIAYLKELHGIFGDWTTVMAGYNCGEYRVLRTIRRQNVNYLDNFWDLYQMLPRETARYVPKFMAALHIIDNLDKYGMQDVAVDEPVEFETVSIEKQVHLKDVAKALAIGRETLVDLNPELRYKILPDEPYELKIPPGKHELLLAKIEDIPEYTEAAPAIAYHRVRRGETLSTIAQRYRTSVRQIALYNNINRHNYIVAGNILKIPHAGASAPASTSSESPITYKVRRGDSLWTLAKRYNTTTKKIQSLNNMESVNLYIGQTLKIPGKGYKGTEVYRVKRGDTPYTIAKKHQMGLNQLLRANNLSRHSTIYPGQRLYVK